MLRINRSEEDGAVVATMIGAIEETVDFSETIGETGPKLKVVTKLVTRINSLGVKSWVRYFDQLNRSGIEVVFSQCSPAIVAQLNLISNFNCGGAVESIYVPYVCQSCNAELVALFTTDALRKTQFRIPSLTCTKCQSTRTVFDDIPEEYFSFMMRS